jgi:hypothetical protein
MPNINRLPNRPPQAGNSPPSQPDYVVTADMPDGQPLPPYFEVGSIWQIVRRHAGRTLWRRTKQVRS